jgi:hypothetical protein
MPEKNQRAKEKLQFCRNKYTTKPISGNFERMPLGLREIFWLWILEENHNHERGLKRIQ